MVRFIVYGVSEDKCKTILNIRLDCTNTGFNLEHLGLNKPWCNADTISPYFFFHVKLVSDVPFYRPRVSEGN